MAVKMNSKIRTFPIPESKGPIVPISFDQYYFKELGLFHCNVLAEIECFKKNLGNFLKDSKLASFHKPTYLKMLKNLELELKIACGDIVGQIMQLSDNLQEQFEEQLEIDAKNEQEILPSNIAGNSDVFLYIKQENEVKQEADAIECVIETDEVIDIKEELLSITVPTAPSSGDSKINVTILKDQDKLHDKMINTSDNDTSNLELCDAESPKPANNLSRYKCFICKKLFARRGGLRAHIRTHTGERPFQCEQCGKSFRHETAFGRHKECHTVRIPSECKECGKQFINKDHFREHLKSHTSENMFTCNVCGKVLASRASRKFHMRLHTGEKPHKCEYCGKCFARVAACNVHKRIHTGERPYQCAECGKSFMQFGGYNDHLRIHTGEKPHECTECGKKFRVLTALKTHMRSHTGYKPYKCDVCDKSFAIYAVLVNHIRTHTGEQPFQCDECGKRFSQKANLHQHSIIHTGEKPCKCTICGKAYSSLSSLIKHKKLHKKVEVENEKDKGAEN